MSRILSQAFTNWEEALHERAAMEAGFDDFGDQAYRLGLRRLLSAYEAGSPAGLRPRLRIFQLLVSVLVSRLHSQRGWKENPECLRTTVRAPLIITGLPRTGTTTLQKLLSLDPQFQGLQNWLTYTPCVRPPSSSWESNSNFQAAVSRYRRLNEEAPDFKKVHDVAAGEVDECLRLVAQDFCSNLFGGLWDVPTYDEWFLSTDMRPSFDRYANNLGLIGFGQGDRRWLLKDPAHMLHLQGLMETFPDAKIIHMHRDPESAVASISSLYSILRGVFTGSEGKLDYAQIGRREVKIWSEATLRMSRVRAKYPNRFLDVSLSEFGANQLTCIKRLYERLDLEFTSQTEGHMRRWMESNPISKHGSHRYSPTQFEIHSPTVRRLFESYIASYQS
jgi:hypothetical protein